MTEKVLEFLRGAVRPTLTWGGFAILSVLTLMGKFDIGTYGTMVGMMVVYYFRERDKPNGL